MEEAGTVTDFKRGTERAEDAADRWFHSCPACLGVFATEETAGTRWPSPPACPFCGGLGVELMGQVRLNRVSIVWDASPCDGSCTAALGPVCVCRCGGVNHGTRRIVRYERIAGETQAVAGLADAAARDATKFRRQGEEWRALRTEADALVQARWGELVVRKGRGEFLSGPEFQGYLASHEARRRIRETTEMRSHKGRMTRLRRVLEEIGAVEVRA